MHVRAVSVALAHGAILAGCSLAVSLDGLTGGATDAGAPFDAAVGDASFGPDAGDASSPHDASSFSDASDAPTDGAGVQLDAGDACVPVTTGLLAHYTMASATIQGTTLGDVSGNGNNAQLFGFPSPPTTDAGPFGVALEYPDAGAAYVYEGTLPLDVAMGHENTFSFWYYRDSLTQANDVLVFAPAAPFYDIWLINQGLCFNNGNYVCWGVSDPRLFDQWLHVVAVFHNGWTAGSTLYIDGQLQNSTCIDLGMDASCDVDATSSAPVYFGGSGVTGFPFRGLLDEVRVYDRALTAAEVAALYDGTACP